VGGNAPAKTNNTHYCSSVPIGRLVRQHNILQFRSDKRFWSAASVTRWVGEKIAQNVAQARVFKLHAMFIIWATYLCNKKLSKENNLPMGKNLPNLVTLLATKKTLDWFGLGSFHLPIFWVSLAEYRQKIKNFKNTGSILKAQYLGPVLWFLKYFRRKIRRKKWRFWLKTKLVCKKIWS
jgi:hypothetical protein